MRKDTHTNRENYGKHYEGDIKFFVHKIDGGKLKVEVDPTEKKRYREAYDDGYRGGGFSDDTPRLFFLFCEFFKKITEIIHFDYTVPFLGSCLVYHI